jgi:D-xylose 1-dehydrogenase (NADP+, D-xylono-1,5-lactone-forming)
MAERLRFGVLGGAGIAKAALVPAIDRAGNAELAGFGSRDPERTRQSFGLPPEAEVVRYEALIADPDIDAIYIPLPNSLHAEWALRAAESGKAVLCEKPLALNAEEAARVVRRCAELGAPLMEAFMYRSHPQHARVREIIASGEIGDVVEVRAHLCVDIMSPADPSNVRFSPDLGGGSLLDMGCYTVSICRMILGMEPLSVSGSWQVDPRFDVDVSAAAVLDFPEGRTGVISCSFLGNAQGSYTVVGRSGAIEVPRAIIPGLGSRIGEALLIVADAEGRRREETLPAVDQYQLMVERFSEAVLARRPVPLPPSDSIENMRVLDAIALSAREGIRVTL